MVFVLDTTNSTRPSAGPGGVVPRKNWLLSFTEMHAAIRDHVNTVNYLAKELQQTVPMNPG